jgi:nucleoside-diphosphate-sugar epimerase
LLARGHQVRVVDVGYFGLGHLRALRPAVEVLRRDLRELIADPAVCQTLLNECDCVIHLAAISNDPSAELNPELTESVNFHTTQILARAARDRGIRFLFSSSCSVYGAAEGDITENGIVSPLTTYAVSKVKAEQELHALTDASWSPVILRNGTLFGYSPRMRFDLVVNIFSLHSALYNELKIFGDGQQWRPFLHVNDCARAFVFFAEQPSLPYRCYNIAHENSRVTDVAAVFQCLNPSLRVTHLALPEADQRDYRVSTRRMQDTGFRTRVDIGMGAEEMIDAIVSGVIPDPESIYYRNAKWLKELTQIGSKDHREVVSLMETLAEMRPR